jgi:AcrR family transcriptional regulator
VKIVSTTDSRVRNPRGQGSRLRDDIVAAAVDILETTGSHEAITLRAVARHVGISAPSIYGHFADREAIVAAVIRDGFVELTDTLLSAIAVSDDPVERLRLGCQAYLSFGKEHPQVYQLMFADPAAATVKDSPGGFDEGDAAFAVLVEGVRDVAAQGRSASTDHNFDAVTIWVALHGFATLSCHASAFPWPDRDVLVDALISRLALLRP